MVKVKKTALTPEVSVNEQDVACLLNIRDVNIMLTNSRHAVGGATLPSAIVGEKNGEKYSVKYDHPLAALIKMFIDKFNVLHKKKIHHKT